MSSTAESMTYCRKECVVDGSCILEWMPHISVDVGKDAMPTPWSLRALVNISGLRNRDATYPSTGQNSVAVLTIVVEIKMLEQGLEASLGNELSKHHQQIAG